MKYIKYTSFFYLISYYLLGDNMKDKFKILGVLLLAGFSFYYSKKSADFIRKQDPIMNEINKAKNTIMIAKVDPIIINYDYITGINGCVIDAKESYDKMKRYGEYNKDLLVMKEDKIVFKNDKFIISGNNKKRNVSIILLNYKNDNINNFIDKNHIKINFFVDRNNIKKDISVLIDLSKNSNIYNYGHNKKYDDKYILYDNSIIESNFNNISNYCLVSEDDKDTLNTCKKYKMKTIKAKEINNNIIDNIKTNLSNGKIFLINTDNYKDLKYGINYILSKGYNIVLLDDLLSETNSCKY